MCGRCIAWRPFFDRARAVGRYQGALQEAIHALKYHRSPLLAAPLGGLLSVCGGQMLADTSYDAVIPVPLHPSRLRRRGFNQALLLARKAAKAWGVGVLADSLRKHSVTIPQSMLSKREREKSVKGVFVYQGPDLQGKNVVLIDDVFTTGSTANECARMLKKHGAHIVDVLTLARTQ